MLTLPTSRPIALPISNADFVRSTPLKVGDGDKQSLCACRVHSFGMEVRATPERVYDPTVSRREVSSAHGPVGKQTAFNKALKHDTWIAIASVKRNTGIRRTNFFFVTFKGGNRIALCQ